MGYGGLSLATYNATLTASASGATSQISSNFAGPTQQIVYTPGAGAGLSGYEIDLSPGNTSGTFTVSEIGFSNSPYDQAFASSFGGSGCPFASVTPASGTTFTVLEGLYSGPSTSCALNVSDGAKVLPVTVNVSPIELDPPSLTFTGTAPQNMTVSEGGYTETFDVSSTSSCLYSNGVNYATIAPEVFSDVARRTGANGRVKPQTPGTLDYFTITPLNPGTCTFTFTDSSGNTANLSVSISSVP